MRMRFLLIVVIILLATPANATQVLTTMIFPEPDSPVKILECDGRLLNDGAGDLNRFFSGGCQMRNESPSQTAVAVRIHWVFCDNFYNAIGDYYSDLTGTYSPGVVIDLHGQFNTEYFNFPVTTPNAEYLIVVVSNIRFADGTVVAPNIKADSDLMKRRRETAPLPYTTYPPSPTPAPSPTP